MSARVMFTERKNLPKAVVPYPFEKHSKGYERVMLVDHSIGAVHQAVGICELQPGGSVDCCLHTNEEAIYLFEGELEMLLDGKAFRLSAEDYALVPYGIPHAYRNRGKKAVRWFEAQAPQPKPPGGWQDTYFFEANWPEKVAAPDFEDPRTRFVGHFKEEAPLFPSGVEGNGPRVHMFIKQELGSQHMLVHRGVFEPGGYLDPHDHAAEESFYGFGGELDLELEGTVYKIRAGDIAFAGVGAAHSWHNRGKEPFRWIETITPQFPTASATRKHRVWEKLLGYQKK